MGKCRDRDKWLLKHRQTAPVEYSSVSSPWPNNLYYCCDHHVHIMYYNLQLNKSYSTANNCKGPSYHI